jgi:hypothetical protein
MKAIAALLIALFVVSPAVFAKASSYYTSSNIIIRRTSNITPQYSSESTARYAATNRTQFSGLTGIFGVSVLPDKKYEQRPFGKTLMQRPAISNVPAGWTGPGGIANTTPGTSTAPCANFGCKASQYVVGDKSTKQFFRCWCDNAKKIAKENIECLNSPGNARHLGFSEGTC